jgi:hypothetical protein
MTTSQRGREGPSSVSHRIAGWLSNRDALPTAVLAVFSYYADTGVFDTDALRLKSRVDEEVDGMIEAAFEPVEAELAREFDRESVAFTYDTKLVMPAKLALGYLFRQYREATPEGLDPVTADYGDVETPDPGAIPTGRTDMDSAVVAVERARDATRLAVIALIDGDMRDAINDDEFEDFEVDFPTTEDDRRRIAEIAQSTLQEAVEAGFDDFPPVVRETYDWAVDISEAHQDEDEHFRSLFERADGGDEDAMTAIEKEYKHAPFEKRPDIFAGDRFADLPYLKTQYDRVGVIYEAMLDMYQHAGFEISDSFKTAIVLAIIAAQIWLDDVDDYAADRREGQLTPVTGEYLLTDDPATAYENVLAITDRYFELAIEHAARSETALTGIAIAYIEKSGDPDVLPR